MRRKIIGFADENLIGKLDRFKTAAAVKSRTAAIAILLEHASRNPQPPLAILEILADSRPCLIVGPSGSGKTTTAKALLSRYEGPCLVLDPSNEYSDFESVGYGSVAALDWSVPRRLRVPLSRDVAVSRIEASLVFRQLNLAMAAGSLRSWVVILEESHRFSADAELAAFILEARKGTRKVLVLAADAGPLEKVAPVFSPLSWEPASASVTDHKMGLW